MAIGHGRLSVAIAIAVFLLNLEICDGRFHYHKCKRSHRSHNHSYCAANQISVPPAASPGKPPAADDGSDSNYSFELLLPISPAQPPVNSKLPPAFSPAQPPVNSSGSKNYSSELSPATSPAQPPNTRNASGSNDGFQFSPVLSPVQPPRTRKDGTGNNDGSELPPVTSPAQPPTTGKSSGNNGSSHLPPAISPAEPPTTGKSSGNNESSQLPPATSPAQPPTTGKSSGNNYSSQLPPMISPAEPPATRKSGGNNGSSQLPPAISPAEPPTMGKSNGNNDSSQLPPAISPAEPPTTGKSSANNDSSQLPPAISPAEPPTTGKSCANNDSSQLPPAISPTEPPTTRKSGSHNDSSHQPPATFPAEPPSTSEHGSKNPGSQLPPVTSPAQPQPPTTSTGGSNNHSFKLPPVISPAEPPNTSKHGHNNSVAQLPPPTSPAKPPAPGKHESNTSSSGPCVFDVRSFGALGDGSSDDTKAFRAAWKAACAADSGVLLVPSDGVFMITSTIFSGPCKTGLVLQMDGVLMPPEGPDCWPAADNKKQWLVFYKVDGMTVEGEGTIEGNGENWWALPCKPHRGPHGSTLPGPCDSPALIRFFLSYNITVRGLRIENSPQFHIKFDACEGVHIEGLSISSPALSPNTDGIHIENTKSVSIHNSIISNGDDCISIGPGCCNVDIANVSCGPSHGISIGSLGVHSSQACVSNVTVRGARIRNSDNGVRIKTWQGGTGTVSGISFEDIYMENVRNCIIIDQYYCMTKQCTNQTSAVRVDGVSYRNIKGTYDVRSPPVHFACSDAVACTNITMAEVELLPHEGVVVDDPFCWNAYGVAETLTIPPVDCLQDGQPQSLQETAGFGCSA